MKFLNFFSTFVGHFCPPGSGSTDLIESISNTDPDPQRCFAGVHGVRGEPAAGHNAREPEGQVPGVRPRRLRLHSQVQKLPPHQGRVGKNPGLI